MILEWTDRQRDQGKMPPFAKITVFMAGKLRHGWDQSMLTKEKEQKLSLPFLEELSGPTWLAG